MTVFLFLMVIAWVALAVDNGDLGHDETTRPRMSDFPRDPSEKL